MHRHACLTFALFLALPASVRAHMCGDYRLAIDAYITTTETGAAIDEAFEAARMGTRASRASRSAIKALTEEAALEIVEAAGAANALEAAEAAGTKAFDTVYDRVNEAAAKLAKANTASREEARIEADEAAGAALDLLSKFKAVTRRTALKAASAAARTSPGATTSKALIAAHENIFRAACL